MSRSALRHLALAVALLMPSAAVSAPESGTVTESEWAAWRERFLDASGRVVDDGNGGISHSEGQGYGLILSYLAGDPASFQLIWSFTRDELMLRDDGLTAWTWNPGSEPHVTDLNNATDGDILIAYALALAGKGWGEAELTQAATDLSKAMAPLIFEQGGRRLILPGATGYARGDRPDGPIVNPSYWVYEAFPVLAELDPDGGWPGVSDGGLGLLPEALIGPRRLPPEWLSVSGRPRPADGFPAVFGYNAVRVPLYLMRAGLGDDALLSGLARSMLGEAGVPSIVTLETGRDGEALSEAGYRVIPAALSCVVEGTPLPAGLATFEPTLYYPSTLHLLALSHLRAEHPECLP